VSKGWLIALGLAILARVCRGVRGLQGPPQAAGAGPAGLTVLLMHLHRRELELGVPGADPIYWE
jgi:hypothetical protein